MLLSGDTYRCNKMLSYGETISGVLGAATGRAAPEQRGPELHRTRVQMTTDCSSCKNPNPE